ncbi:MAG TPA: hypothetical protein VHB77_10175 [Planctomycetaceae bacterium]|nr:hypothetical protein [Planctomycetaceae bacterium]
MIKRWIAYAVISGYLGILTVGLASHILNVGTAAHPLMYYIVWDMFCGWSAYGNETYVIGEGESGRFYQLAPGPWGEIIPYGSQGRQHYDSFLNHVGGIAMNTLRHTEHEPITRFYIVEQMWAKKYDLADWVWNNCYTEPKDRQFYCHLRGEFNGSGQVLRRYPSWLETQGMQIMTDNPKIQAEMRARQSFFMVDQQKSGPGYYGAGSTGSFSSIPSPRAN